ncbi:Uncharacterized protein YlaN, UPF0358 family [Carnobacterium iners]|uniref:Uncharacterized protein YlaN, UPF0358 family n=1 Tax=Carnobacterium iners TaxID=1073423 RepID=A0A1X7NMN5_9LACT|nr:DUF1507 family protein [Carnobacterium iners]SEK70612.1 Uncharacterized protein YlaN, UPF0358 family [Carnobacterium iners]SMH38599.1 Uncharacterized protein YlaN, UPF0358 family [Carnobacterium iners]
MLNNIQKKEALEVLLEDATKIFQLINNQKNQLCLTECPAFNEIVDTQMFGLSKEISFAKKIGVINSTEGDRILSDLEKKLNDLYTKAYNEKNL